jgi:GH25 family lysozyme M1 (1,4-beta-N-acetylmuramidase)
MPDKIVPSDEEQWQHQHYGEQDRARNRPQSSVGPKPGVPKPGSGNGVLLPESTTGIPASDSDIIWGADFAGYWDGMPDMRRLKDRGGHFVYIKAADGTLQARFFRENVANAKAAGLVVGAYFWLYRDIRIPCVTQAKAWWNIVKDLDLDFHVVDFEWTSWHGKLDNPTSSDLRASIDAFQDVSGKVMWIYTAPGYAAESFNHQPRFLANPLIVAHYQANPAAIAPWGPNGHTMHQISETWPGAELGVDPNYAHAVDGDIFNGDLVKFAATFHLGLQAREGLGLEVAVRTSPQYGSSDSSQPAIPPGGTVPVVKVLDDLQRPGQVYYKWLQLDEAGTQFVKYTYPPYGKRFDLVLSRPASPSSSLS